MTFLMAIFFLGAGLIGLVLGADWLVDGAIGIARFFRLSPIWVGTVLVGIATTLPEMMVSWVAVTHGHIGISLGNALGSYVANIGLVLGMTAMFYPLKINATMFQRELPMLTMAYVLLVLLLMDQFLSRIDGVVLLLALAVFLVTISRYVLRQPTRQTPTMPEETTQASLKVYPIAIFMLVFIVGVATTWLAAQAMVMGAKVVALHYGMSDLVIGLTIVAVGTSLPELAASLTCVRKGHHDLAVGNVLGSNIFGILGVVAIPGLLAPNPVAQNVVTRDLVMMGCMTVALWAVAYSRDQQRATIKRGEGLLLCVLFVGYMLWTLLGSSV